MVQLASGASRSHRSTAASRFSEHCPDGDLGLEDLHYWRHDIQILRHRDGTSVSGSSSIYFGSSGYLCIFVDAGRRLAFAFARALKKLILVWWLANRRCIHATRMASFIGISSHLTSFSILIQRRVLSLTSMPRAAAMDVDCRTQTPEPQATKHPK